MLKKATFSDSTVSMSVHSDNVSISLTHGQVLARADFPEAHSGISSQAHVKVVSTRSGSWSVQALGSNPVQILRKGSKSPETVLKDGEPVRVAHGDGILLVPNQWDLLYTLHAPQDSASSRSTKKARTGAVSSTSYTATTSTTTTTTVTYSGSPDRSLAPPAAASSSRRSPRKRGADGRVVNSSPKPEKVGNDREPMRLPGVMLAHKWEATVSPKGWHMSEKLDGLRAIWDGHVFQSRTGTKFCAPPFFVAGLPKDLVLDGELFVGRSRFSEATSIVRSGEKPENVARWNDVTYMVFDVLDVGLKWEQRYAVLTKLFSNQVPFAKLVEQVPCKSEDHLREELARIEALGGEGVMLRKPKSHYATSRSRDLLKVKSFLDSEAIVVGKNPGQGKHEGLMGALVVENADGVQFKVGTGFTDQDRRNPPKKGAIITYRYQELSKDGVPRFPSFVGERIDMDWPPPPTSLGPRTVSLTATPHSQKTAAATLKKNKAKQ